MTSWALSGPGGVDSNPASQARSQFRDQLLPATLRHAVRLPGYQSLWSDRVESVADRTSWQYLAPLEKERIRSDPDGFWDRSLEVGVLQHTTGTTGAPLIIRRSKAELQFVRNFFERVQCNKSAPFCIYPVAEYHGMPTPAPYPGRVFSFNAADQFWDLSKIASRPWEYFGEPPSPVILVGLENEIRQFTIRLVEMGFDFSTTAVKSICSTGDLLTTRLAEWYRATWGVDNVSRFGLTEAFGGALPCGVCGYLHFDPFLVGEVVDAFTYEPIESGCGLLLITCLYPFVQQQPFIRYVTGDFVRLGPADCPVDRMAFHLLGRVRSSILEADSTGHTGAEPLLAGNEMYDVLDNFPDVARAEVQVNINGFVRNIADHGALGPVRAVSSYTGSGAGGTITVRVETRYSAYMHSTAERRLLAEISERLLSRHPRLAKLSAEGSHRLEVTTALPGTLGKFRSDEPE